MRFYDAVISSLPYMVLVVGAFSTFLGVYALMTLDDAPFQAWMSLLFGAFLIWSGVSVLQQRRAEAERAARDDE